MQQEVGGKLKFLARTKDNQRWHPYLFVGQSTMDCWFLYSYKLLYWPIYIYLSTKNPSLPRCIGQIRQLWSSSCTITWLTSWVLPSIVRQGCVVWTLRPSETFPLLGRCSGFWVRWSENHGDGCGEHATWPPGHSEVEIPWLDVAWQSEVIVTTWTARNSFLCQSENGIPSAVFFYSGHHLFLQTTSISSLGTQKTGL
jgi:hypothetical protein